jgi:hypothetical protein
MTDLTEVGGKEWQERQELPPPSSDSVPAGSSDAMKMTAMKRQVGRLQKAARRCFIVSNGEAVQTADFLRRAFPRLTKFENWRYRAARRAALRFAIPVGRSERKGRPLLWMPNKELRQLIGGPRQSDS